MFCADDTPFYIDQQGDTVEIIDDLNKPSNNFFVWTMAIQPPGEPEPEPEPEASTSNLADFEILSDSSYNTSTNIVTIKIKNSGSITSTGFNNYDYRPFFEVSDVSSTAQSVVGILDGDTPIYVKDGDNIKTYYAKSDGGWSSIPIQNLSISSDSSDLSYNIEYSGQNTSYILTTPLHEPEDTITLSFELITSGSNSFIPGRTYIFCADDAQYNQTGDTVEKIDDNTNPSNNYFVWTIPEQPTQPGEPEPEPEPESENPIFSINYTDTRLDGIVTESKNILNDILTSSPNETIEIDLYVSSTLDDDILGQASWYYKQIWLNEKNLTDTNTFKLNDISLNMNVPVLIHEILHVFGLVGIGDGESFANGDNDSPPNVYTGTNGVIQYKNVLEANSKSTVGISYVPMEDDFGLGTKMSHFEEGQDSFGDETREINGTIYPVLRNELMSGFLNGGDNYLTPMTLGLLEDLGYGVNYGSPHVVSTGNYFWWIPGNNSSLQYLNYNTSRNCKNCKVIHK
jgi:hypothetical protein